MSAETIPSQSTERQPMEVSYDSAELTFHITQAEEILASDEPGATPEIKIAALEAKIATMAELLYPDAEALRQHSALVHALDEAEINPDGLASEIKQTMITEATTDLTLWERQHAAVTRANRLRSAALVHQFLDPRLEQKFVDLLGLDGEAEAVYGHDFAVVRGAVLHEHDLMEPKAEGQPRSLGTRLKTGMAALVGVMRP